MGNNNCVMKVTQAIATSVLVAIACVTFMTQLLFPIAILIFHLL